MNKILYRSQNDKIVAGVCGGLAEYFDIDATIIRLLFILIIAFGGSGFIIYLLLWLIMPKGQGEPAIVTKEKIEEMAQEIKNRAEEIRENVKKEEIKPEVKENNPEINRRRGGLFGWVLLVLGLVFLFNNLAPLWMRIHLYAYWPLLLVFFGLAMIANSKKQ